MICVSISSFSQITEVAHLNPKMIELRLDLIGKEPREIFTQLPEDIITIATCRPGKYSQEHNIELLKSCMDQGASFIDIEMERSPDSFSELKDHAQKCATDVIVSYHNFDSTPDRNTLVEILTSCYELGGSIAKIATSVHFINDTKNLLSLYDLPGKKVVIGMGSMGRITRIMAPYLGAEFTFASPVHGGETAPGQLNIAQLNELYKVIDES